MLDLMINQTDNHSTCNIHYSTCCEGKGTLSVADTQSPVCSALLAFQMTQG